MPLTPLTINQPVPFGRHRDGGLAAAELRQACAAIAGQPGSGKTIVEHNLVAGLCRCPDALVWLVDLSQGGLANAWLNPWLDRGCAGRPVVDWVALDLESAYAMLFAAHGIILRRRVAYRQWMARRGTDKLPVCPDVPAVEIVIDEGKKVTGASADQKLLRKIIEVADEGRAMAVRIIITVLRGTAEVLPSEMMADIGTRVGMSVSSAAESNYLFGWNHKPNPRDTPYPGCGLWRTDLSGPPVPFRSFDLSDPGRIARVADACEPWRPTLDEGSLEGLAPALREAYAGRWERTVEVLTGGGPPGVVQPVDRAGPTVAHGAAGPHVGQRFTPTGPGVVDLTAVHRAVSWAKRAVHAEGMVGDRVDTAWQELAEELDADRAAGGEGWGDDTDADETPEGEGRAKLLTVLRGAGREGMSGPAAHAALRTAGVVVSVRTVYRWLRKDAVDCGYRKYVHPDFGSDK